MSDMMEKVEADSDLAEVLGRFTNLILNERIRCYNEGVDANRQRFLPIDMASLAHAFGVPVSKVHKALETLGGPLFRERSL